MFKKWLALLLIPAFLFSFEASKTYTFKQPSIVGDAILMEGCQSSYTAFAPRLPIKNVTLWLPRGEEAVSFDVEYSKPVKIAGSHYIADFLPGGRIGVAPPSDYYTRTSSVYSVDAFYPSEVKSPRFFTHYRYGHSIFIASIRPVQYNPVIGKVHYFKEITVKVTTNKKRGPLPAYKFSPFIKSQLQLEVDNPDALEGLSYIPKRADDYEYALITTDALKDSWDDFVEFNTERALRTRISTIEDINAKYPGSHQADKLKNYLIEQYNDHNITFVMLGGDDKISTTNQILSDAITHKSYDAEFKDYGTDYIRDQDIAADMFYETLDGQELEDLEWELYAARFPCDDKTELQKMIQKTITYSKNPETDVLKKSVLAGEHLWTNINGGSCYGIDCMTLLKGSCSKYYNTKGFDNSFTHIELQERNGSWSGSTIASHMNNGVHTVDHLGHSNSYYIMKMYQNDVLALRNSAFFIGFTEGCYCGSWDNRKLSLNASFTTGHNAQDCIAEDFTVGTQNAAVAYISNTRYGLGDNGRASSEGTDGSSIRIQRFFWDGMFGQNMHHLAMMLAYAKWINKQQILNTDINATPYFGQLTYCAYQVCALADPALSIWSEVPKTYDPDLPSEITTTNFVFKSGHPYTCVLLCKENGESITQQMSGEDGKINITDDALKQYIEANAGGTLKVRIKAHNYYPFVKDITIASSGIINNDFGLNLFTTNFNTSNKFANIKYSVPKSSLVNISLYNSKGISVKTLVNEYQTAGRYVKTYNSNDLVSGIYYCRLTINNAQSAKKFIVTK